MHSSRGAELDVNTRVGTRVLEIRHQRLIVRGDLLDILRLSHQFFESLAYSIHRILSRVYTHRHSTA